MWIGLFGDSERKVLSSVSAFLYSTCCVVAKTKIPIGVGLRIIILGMGMTEKKSFAKREIEVLPHRCELGRSNELYSTRISGSKDSSASAKCTT